MNNNIKYSICATVYNSAEIIEEAIKPYLELGDEYEIIITDNKSKDGTFEILKKYEPKIKTISFKCTRGLGRNKAMELSQGKILIFLMDLDVAYFNIKDLINLYLKDFQNFVLQIYPKNPACNAEIIICKRELFELLEFFPDLNNSEDLYFVKKAEALNLLKSISLDIKHRCLSVKEKNSGKESRYEKNFIKKIIRRIKTTRDILFVHNFKYSQLMEWYNLKGFKKFYIGLPLYIIGKFLTYFIKVPKLEKEIERLKNKVSNLNLISINK